VCVCVCVPLKTQIKYQRTQYGATQSCVKLSNANRHVKQLSGNRHSNLKQIVESNVRDTDHIADYVFYVHNDTNNPSQPKTIVKMNGKDVVVVIDGDSRLDILDETMNKSIQVSKCKSNLYGYIRMINHSLSRAVHWLGRNARQNKMVPSTVVIVKGKHGNLMTGQTTK